MSLYFKKKDAKNWDQSFIKSNKNMSPHSPIQKNLIKKSHSIKAETRRAVSKLAKSTIIISKKETLQKKLEKKFKKFEIRNNKTVRLILGLFFCE